MVLLILLVQHYNPSQNDHKESFLVGVSLKPSEHTDIIIIYSVRGGAKAVTHAHTILATPL